MIGPKVLLSHTGSTATFIHPSTGLTICVRLGNAHGPRWICKLDRTQPLMSWAMQYMAIEFMPTTTSGNAQRRQP